MKGVQTGMLLEGIKLIIVEHKKQKEQGLTANLNGMRESLYLLTKLVKEDSPTVFDKHPWLKTTYDSCKPQKS